MREQALFGALYRGLRKYTATLVYVCPCGTTHGEHTVTFTCLERHNFFRADGGRWMRVVHSRCATCRGEP